MSGMLDEIADTMAVAARAGAQFGRNLQNRKIQESWENYADNLKDQLANVRSELAIKTSHAMLKDAVIQNQDLKINDLVAKIKERDAKILLVTEDGDHQYQRACAYQRSLIEKVSTIERACRATSGKLAFYEELYKLIAQEIKLCGDPEKLKLIDPVSRKAVIDRVWENFMKTGKTVYDPDLDFTYLDETKNTLRSPSL